MRRRRAAHIDSPIPKPKAPCPRDCFARDAYGCCEYILITGKARGCPPGPDCARYKPRDGRRPPRRPQLPTPPPSRTELIREARPSAPPSSTVFLSSSEEVILLYCRGGSDAEIAAATGWAPSTVRKWREKNGLPSRWDRRKGRKRHGDKDDDPQ